MDLQTEQERKKEHTKRVIRGELIRVGVSIFEMDRLTDAIYDILQSPPFSTAFDLLHFNEQLQKEVSKYKDPPDHLILEHIQPPCFEDESARWLRKIWAFRERKAAKKKQWTAKDLRAKKQKANNGRKRRRKTKRPHTRNRNGVRR